jgi:hypothetical protein
MSQSDRRNSSPSLEWLNPSSEWAHEDYGARPAAASEPYDWTLKDGESRHTQVIPLISPVGSGSKKLGWLKRKAGVSKPSPTIRLKKNSTGKIIRRRITSLIRPVTTKPLTESSAAIPILEKNKTGRLVRSYKTEVRRKSPGWALPLLLLAVIALFVFAYIAQK